MNDKEILKEFLNCRPVDEISIRRIVDNILNENAKLKLAISTSNNNKYKYAGKIEEDFFLESSLPSGDTVILNQKRKVPWSVIRDVLSLVHLNFKDKL